MIVPFNKNQRSGNRSIITDKRKVRLNFNIAVFLNKLNLQQFDKGSSDISKAAIISNGKCLPASANVSVVPGQFDTDTVRVKAAKNQVLYGHL